MNKRNAAAASSANGQDGTDGDEGVSGTFSLPSISASERLRNPFADDEDDEEGGSGSGSGSGSEDGDGENADDDGGVGSSSWNRGSWWRGVVRRARRGNRKSDPDKPETERFGDGRDSSDESNDAKDEDEVEEVDDEEFGDFAMPEVEGGQSDNQPGEAVTGIDPSRDKILLKPLPVHPSASKTGPSPFGSLWPFSSQGFGAKDRKDEKESSESEEAENMSTDGASEEKNVSEEPVEIEEPVVGEDGQKIDRAIEAKRRTSIEDPDEDDVDIDEEIIVGRPGLT